MEKPAKANRDLRIDNIKGMLIFLVVLGHFAEVFDHDMDLCKGIFLFIYTFHMPGFLFLSGMFHSNEKVWERAARLFLCGYLLKICIFAVRILCGANIAFHPLTESGPPWFLFTLSLFVAVTYLLRKANPAAVFAIAFAASCISGYFRGIGDFLVLSRSIVYYPFYLLGMYAYSLCKKRGGIGTVISSVGIWVKVFAGVLVAAWGTVCILFVSDVYFLRPLFTGRNPFPEEMGPGGILFRLLCFFIALSMILAILLVTPDRSVPVITDAGGKTLQILFWQSIAMALIYSCNIRRFVLLYGIWGTILFMAASFVLCYILTCPFFRYPFYFLNRRMSK